MANTKTYIVVKDGTELKTLKTLTAAKKLAEEEEAEVICDGKVVYSPIDLVSPTADTPVEEKTEVAEEVPTPQQYTLLSRMNIRKAPSLNADKLGIAEPGTAVEVTEVKDDWLHLTDGTFILYAGGKFATKN